MILKLVGQEQFSTNHLSGANQGRNKLDFNGVHTYLWATEVMSPRLSQIRQEVRYGIYTESWWRCLVKTFFLKLVSSLFP